MCVQLQDVVGDRFSRCPSQRRAKLLMKRTARPITDHMNLGRILDDEHIHSLLAYCIKYI
jgi:hypothetical protein